MLALALSLSAHAAVAAPVTPAVIDSSSPGPESSSAVRAILVEELTSLGVEVADGFGMARESLRSGAVLETDLVPFRQAQELSAEGWRSYLEVRASFAAARLSEARTVALGVAHLEGGRELLAEISLRLAVVKLDLERGEEAGDDFRLAHMLAPGRAVTDAEFKPEAVHAYRVALAATSSVHLRRVPVRPGLRLWVDGTEIFGGDVRLSEGLHLLEAKADGALSRSKLLLVSPGPSPAIRLELENDPVASRILIGEAGVGVGATEGQARDATTAMLLYSQTESLLTVASVWRRGAPALLAQRCSGIPAHCSAVVEIGYSDGGVRAAARELWQRLAGAELRFPPTLQVDRRVVSAESRPGPREPAADTPLWKNRWLWLGVAAASVVGSAVYLLAEPDPGATFFVGDTCDFGGC